MSIYEGKGKKLQKFEYLQNQKSFLDEIKKDFPQFLKAYLLMKKQKFDKKQQTPALNNIAIKKEEKKNEEKINYLECQSTFDENRTTWLSPL